MRKIFAIILASVLVFAGCTREEQDKVAISLTAQPASVSTRVVDDISQDALFDNGEQVDVFVTDLTGTTVYARPEVYTVNGTTAVGSVTGNILETNPQQFYPRGSVSIRAYFPHGIAGTSDTGVETITVASDQTSIADYKASDLMAASVPSQSPTSRNVNLPFSHKMARMAVYVETMNGFDQADIVSISLAAKLKTDFNKETLATTLTASGNDVTDVTLVGAGGRLGACIVPPQTMAATSGTAGYLLKVVINRGGTTQNLYYRNTAPLDMMEGNTYLVRLKCSNSVITGYTAAVASWGTPSTDQELLGELLKLLEGTATITPYTDGTGTSAGLEWGAELD